MTVTVRQVGGALGEAVNKGKLPGSVAELFHGLQSQEPRCPVNGARYEINIVVANFDMIGTPMAYCIENYQGIYVNGTNFIVVCPDRREGYEHVCRKTTAAKLTLPATLIMGTVMVVYVIVGKRRAVR